MEKIGAVLAAMENPVESTDGYYGGEDWTYEGIVLENYPGVEYGSASSSHDCEDVKSVLEVKLGSSCKLKEIYLIFRSIRVGSRARSLHWRRSLAITSRGMSLIARKIVLGTRPTTHSYLSRL